MAETKRQKKTPRQRAEEALGIASRKVTALEGKLKALTTQREAVQGELAEAKARHAYLEQSPDLAEQTTIEDRLAEDPPQEGSPPEERPPYQK